MKSSRASSTKTSRITSSTCRMSARRSGAANWRRDIPRRRHRSRLLPRSPPPTAPPSSMAPIRPPSCACAMAPNTRPSPTSPTSTTSPPLRRPTCPSQLATQEDTHLGRSDTPILAMTNRELARPHPRQERPPWYLIEFISASPIPPPVSSSCWSASPSASPRGAAARAPASSSPSCSSSSTTSCRPPAPPWPAKTKSLPSSASGGQCPLCASAASSCCVRCPPAARPLPRSPLRQLVPPARPKNPPLPPAHIRLAAREARHPRTLSPHPRRIRPPRIPHHLRHGAGHLCHAHARLHLL